MDHGLLRSHKGDYPIDNAVLVVVDPGADHVRPGEQSGTAMELVLGTVMSKQTASGTQEVRFTAEPAFGELLGLASLLFTDTWNQTWHRGSMILERRSHPPRIC